MLNAKEQHRAFSRRDHIHQRLQVLLSPLGDRIRKGDNAVILVIWPRTQGDVFHFNKGMRVGPLAQRQIKAAVPVFHLPLHATGRIQRRDLSGPHRFFHQRIGAGGIDPGPVAVSHLQGFQGVAIFAFGVAAVGNQRLLRFTQHAIFHGPGIRAMHGNLAAIGANHIRHEPFIATQ